MDAAPRTNAEIRKWYLDEISLIPKMDAQWRIVGRTARWRAEEAHRFRHKARLSARSMMRNPAEVEMLRARDMLKYGNSDGPTFDFLVEKLQAAGIAGDALYEKIVEISYSTDKELNRSMGL